MPLAPRLPADNILMDTLAIIKMPHVVLFIIFLFLLGNFWGFIESYVFLYLKELGASNYLLGKLLTSCRLSGSFLTISFFRNNRYDWHHKLNALFIRSREVNKKIWPYKHHSFIIFYSRYTINGIFIYRVRIKINYFKKIPLIKICTFQRSLVVLSFRSDGSLIRSSYVDRCCHLLRFTGP